MDNSPNFAEPSTKEPRKELSMEYMGHQIKRILLENNKKKRISSGSYYSFLLVRAGNCTFYDDEAGHQVWHCGPDDIFLMKPDTSVHLQCRGAKHPAELFWIQYSEDLLEQLSDSRVNLKTSMEVVPFSCISVSPDNETIAILKNLYTRLEKAEDTESEFAAELFVRNILSIMIIIILRACIRVEFEKCRRGQRQFVLDDLFGYIHRHLTEELTLEVLEKVFFVSRYHICREFKKQTGQTIHSYITKSRLRLCKKYILEGLPITEVYKLAGFGGYNHFFRAFKKEFQMTPKEYYKSHMQK